ncbi:MAG: hypothetical protein ACK4K4_00985 [Caldimicrobium sp.]
MIYTLIFLFWAKFVFSASIIINPPQIHPEKEFEYLKNPISQFLRERLGYINVNVQGPKEDKVLISAFQFEQQGRVKIDLTLQGQTTGEPSFKRTYETTFEDFWKTLEKGTEDIKKILYHNSETIPVAPSDKITESKPALYSYTNALYFKSETKPSFFSKINPINLFSKLIPKKENPLSIKLQVPPPPPPSILSASNILSPDPFVSTAQGLMPSLKPQSNFSQNEPKMPENIPQRIPSSQNSSPWKWL